ncbi:hypothetical protein QJS10_CPB17g00380 [Acorus calamus]|uniref:Uncharacterized protein n=1 Tax=Acorus calamus TaxID=4465 RepID=A0AAV9CUK2_ACOCL|nr:hypothetical protein QJS10_CPB17g00380 [Acorus calamus]
MRRSSRRRSVRSVEGVLVPRTSAFVNLVGETTNAGISNRQRASTSLEWGENDALNMQFKIPGREEYDTLANEHDRIAMFNMHQGSPNIEIFITIEHDVHPTPDDRGFQSDEMFGVESQNDGFVDPMEALSSFLDREGNGVDYAIFYDSEEEHSMRRPPDRPRKLEGLVKQCKVVKFKLHLINLLLENHSFQFIGLPIEKGNK